MKTSIIGYPRIGSHRELKFWTEGYFKGEISADTLQANAKKLRREQWALQAQKGIDFIPSNDFSFYDGMLDTVFLLNVIPKRYKSLGLDTLSTYFAMARGYQEKNGDVKALSMRKWFNTNYHYMVPEIDDDTKINLSGDKIFIEYREALSYGIKTKPVIVGGFTFLKLAKYKGEKKLNSFVDDIINAYINIFNELNRLGAEWVQIDEPVLVTDLNYDDVKIFAKIYTELLKSKGNLKILLQTYFGDIRDCYNEAVGLDFDGFGFDFIEGKQALDLIKTNSFPKGKILFTGVLNGKNIWKNNYNKTLNTLDELAGYVNRDNIIINTSCSLLHVPYTVQNEEKLDKAYFAFAQEKLDELSQLSELFGDKKLIKNTVKITSADDAVNQRLDSLTEKDFTRLPSFDERRKIQSEFFKLPLLPTTTIGSFPQTADVKANRSKLKKGEITLAQYKDNVKNKIAQCIKIQEEIGIDVLVHGEFERNDMAEYFGENLSGFLFTQNAWVQSYGTRCVKPPIILSDVSRSKPITVEYSVFAQSLTDKPVKGMLTGPVTILNWSFPREDISLRDMAFQIALAIRDEVLELEANGIHIIQIDEAALKEKLPLRRDDWHSEYLDWAIPAFRLVHSGVNPITQIHTHMCYSEFEEIMKDIDEMDADVISFEASRSHLSIVDAINKNNFKTAVGPGVYDIHSPRVPSAEEITAAITAMLGKIKAEKLWINPDCGLKTRGEAETIPSLQNLVEAARQIRKRNFE